MNTPLLPALAASRAKDLEFFARTRVDGFLKGGNRSFMRGQSTEFLQHRSYMQGDELRALDWRAFARTDRMMIRQYEEFTNLDVILTLDVSGSMDFSQDGMSKLEFAMRCQAMIAYMLDKQKDRYGLATFTRELTYFLRAANGRKHFAELLRRLGSLSTEGETDFTGCVRQLLKRITRKSVVMIFSDCYQEPAAMTRAAGLLRLQGHDVLLFQVYEPAEAELNFSGFTLFKDLETNQIDSADPLEIRAAYREVFREQTQRLKQGALRHGVEFHQLAVTPDWDRVLSKLLSERV